MRRDIEYLVLIQIGNGYSRMLQMLNVDVKRSSDYPHHSDLDHSGDEGSKKDLVLPKIKAPNGGKLNMSDGNINAEEMEDYDPKPKV